MSVIGCSVAPPWGLCNGTQRQPDSQTSGIGDPAIRYATISPSDGISMTPLRQFSTVVLVTAACASSVAAFARPQAAATPHGRRVAVTIDDLPANMFRGDLTDWQDMTTTLLAGLVRHSVPAIGFVNEQKLYVDGAAEPAPAYVELLRDWLDAGMELGNHTYSHPDLHRTPVAEYERDILRGETITRPLLAEHGAVPRYFRHPFLHTGNDLETRDAVHDFLAEHGYRVAPVTIDNLEYIAARAYDHALVRSDQELAKRIASSYVQYMREVFAYYERQSKALLGYEIPQSLLLHANRLNAAVIDELLGMMRARGYEFVTLDEALEDPAYQSKDEFAGRAGITWLHRWAITAGKRGGFFGSEPDLPGFVHETYANPPSLGETVPMREDAWEFDGDAHNFEQLEGRDALHIERGRAWVKGADLLDGTIEFDLWVEEERNFSGVYFRSVDNGNSEHFYVRQHQSGNPDASQYTPVYNGVAGWQIYVGDGFTVPLELPFERWMHIRVDINGDRAAVYLDSAEPVLIIDDLQRDPVSGGVGFNAGNARFSNITISPGSPEIPAATAAGAEIESAATVPNWRVSNPFAESLVETATTVSAADLGIVSWSALDATERGIANLARVASPAGGQNTVVAALTLRADSAQIVRARFGFSDRVRVFLNGRLLYSGNDNYTSRDYRFLGTIGLFDGVALPLEAGDNELWFAVSEDFGGWGIVAEIAAAAGVEVTR